MQRWWCPPVIIPPDTQAPPRHTPIATIQEAFLDPDSWGPILDRTEVFFTFGSVLGSSNGPYIDAMVQRMFPMLEARGILFGIETGGPLGRAYPVVSSADTGGQNGIKSADFDITNRIERALTTYGAAAVHYIRMDEAMGRLVSNGIFNKADSRAALTLGTAAANTGLRFTAVTAGTAGNSIRVRFVVAGTSTALAVSVSGSDITVDLATDGSGAAVSTAAEVLAAVQASGPATALVTVAHAQGDYAYVSDGSGLVAAVAYTNLFGGDVGINMTSRDAAQEVVAYMDRVHTADPAYASIHFVWKCAAILLPFDGVPGYSGGSYPSGQQPDWIEQWDELVRQIRAAGLEDVFHGHHTDITYEYIEGLVPSANAAADDWYARHFEINRRVRRDGFRAGMTFGSYWGGRAEASGAPADYASDEHWQTQSLAFDAAWREYKAAHYPNDPPLDDDVYQGFYKHPQVWAPHSRRWSFADTGLILNARARAPMLAATSISASSE